QQGGDRWPFVNPAGRVRTSSTTSTAPPTRTPSCIRRAVTGTAAAATMSGLSRRSAPIPTSVSTERGSDVAAGYRRPHLRGRRLVVAAVCGRVDHRGLVDRRRRLDRDGLRG